MWKCKIYGHCFFHTHVWKMTNILSIKSVNLMFCRQSKWYIYKTHKYSIYCTLKYLQRRGEKEKNSEVIYLLMSQTVYPKIYWTMWYQLDCCCCCFFLFTFQLLIDFIKNVHYWMVIPHQNVIGIHNFENILFIIKLDSEMLFQR